MTIALCLVAALLAGIGWWIWRQPGGRRAKPSGEPEAVQEYHAVSITTDGHPCAAVQGIFGQRYLSNAAPSFPLPHCDRSETCACRYEHFHDRRARGDRRDIWVASEAIQAFPEDNRTARKKKDRRTAELVAKT